MRSLFKACLLAFFGLSAGGARAEILCTLIVDAETGAALIEEGACDARVTPASTFKIPLAVMAYDAEILIDAHHPVMAYRAGDPDWGGADWTRDTDPTGWMRYSVLWFSQRIASALGAAELARRAEAFGYGNADFSGDPGFDNGLERAWIASSLLVSPLEQAGFLRALVGGALPVGSSAMARARHRRDARNRR
ncbi:MAG: penicillin-binding transpeptidase domain-containing protein, partial [Paracoccaceae bacterium]